MTIEIFSFRVPRSYDETCKKLIGSFFQSKQTPAFQGLELQERTTARMPSESVETFANRKSGRQFSCQAILIRATQPAEEILDERRARGRSVQVGDDRMMSHRRNRPANLAVLSNYLEITWKSLSDYQRHPSETYFVFFG